MELESLESTPIRFLPESESESLFPESLQPYYSAGRLPACPPSNFLATHYLIEGRERSERSVHRDAAHERACLRPNLTIHSVTPFKTSKNLFLKLDIYELPELETMNQ